MTHKEPHLNKELRKEPHKEPPRSLIGSFSFIRRSLISP